MSEQKPQSNPNANQRDAARRKAQDHFTAAEKRDSEVRREIQREQAATAAKTAKLRALRLIKEEAERIAAANAPAPAPRKSRAKAKAKPQ
jgi:hypothetical protein